MSSNFRDDDLDGGRWWTQVQESTVYEYDNQIQRLQKQEYGFKVYDLPDEGDFGDLLDLGAIGEISGYDDLMGRRIAAFRCDAEDSTSVNWGPNGNCEAELTCKAKTVMYDYYGPSQRVAAVRNSPYQFETCDCEGRYSNIGDTFQESYTYSPVGPVVRTDEQGDADDETFTNHYVAADLWGGTTALLLDAGESNPRTLSAQHFDAFGARATTGEWSESQSLSRYRWRSQEGTETDDLTTTPMAEATLATPYLNYMQTRHYDPGLGRFIMADSIPMGTFSPQGLNRYAYCTNDPVNGSDPSGQAWLDTIVGWGLILLGLAIMTSIVGTIGLPTLLFIAGTFAGGAAIFRGLSMLTPPGPAKNDLKRFGDACIVLSGGCTFWGAESVAAALTGFAAALWTFFHGVL